MKIIIEGLKTRFGFNTNGTGCIECVYCSNWFTMQRYTWHMKHDHPSQYKSLVSQARQIGKGIIK